MFDSEEEDLEGAKEMTHSGTKFSNVRRQGGHEIMNRDEAEQIMQAIDAEEREQSVLEAEFEDWQQLNAKVLHCMSKREAMFSAFEAARKSTFDEEDKNGKGSTE